MQSFHIRSSWALGLVAAVVLAGAFLPTSSSVMAQDKPEGGERPRPARPDGPGREGGREGRRAEGPSVEGAMKAMNRAATALSESIGDAAKKDENLKLIGDMQRGCVGAKSQPLPADMLEKAADEAARAKLAIEFRVDLIKVMRLLLDVEQAILDGKNDAAAKLLAEVQKLREHSHAEMGVKDE